jgi:hypothetical protein
MARSDELVSSGGYPTGMRRSEWRPSTGRPRTARQPVRRSARVRPPCRPRRRTARSLGHPHRRFPCTSRGRPDRGSSTPGSIAWTAGSRSLPRRCSRPCAPGCGRPATGSAPGACPHAWFPRLHVEKVTVQEAAECPHQTSPPGADAGSTRTAVRPTRRWRVTNSLNSKLNRGENPGTGGSGWELGGTVVGRYLDT